MKKNLLIFLFFAVVVYLVNLKSLGLTMYADDWIIMAKFFGIFGPGDIFPYWRIDTWFADYGFQNITPVLFTIFKYNYWIYFAINLFFKSLVSFSIYLFVKKIFNKKTAVISALIFSSTSVGIETTDWVYNMSSYLGIFFALLGFNYLITKNGVKGKIQSWGLAMLGYSVGSIRIFMIPPLLVISQFVKELFASEKITKKSLKTALTGSLILVILILIFRKFTPHLGNPNVALFYVNIGLDTGRKMLEAGRWDFLVYPFITLGQMIFPTGLRELTTAGVRIYPLTHFIFYGGILTLSATLFFVFAMGRRVNKKFIIISFFYSLFAICLLKLFVRYQGEWLLKDFHFFAACYIGIIFTSIAAWKLIGAVLAKKAKTTIFYLVAITAAFGFLFPQLVNPGIIFDPIHRYLAYGSVGVAMLLGKLLTHQDRENVWIRNIKHIFIGLFLIINIIEVDRFYSFQLTARNPKLESEIFSQIRALVSDFPQDAPVVFYFKYPYHKTYYDLLLNSFGYHMQLLYEKDFEEINIPSSVETYEKLISEVQNRKAPLTHVYALFWEGNKFVDRSETVRAQLRRDLDIK